MRLALVIERFHPDTGGVENVAWNVAHGLARAGDEVHVVARRASDSPAVRLHRVRIPTAWQPLRVIAFSPRRVRPSRPSRSMDRNAGPAVSPAAASQSSQASTGHRSVSSPYGITMRPRIKLMASPSSTTVRSDMPVASN